MTTDRPNVVLIVLDSVRRDHLSGYGYARRTTPNIDRIAAEGTRYTRASAAACWTLPSHASLFTGLYPSQHRADFDTRWLDPRHETLASYLGRRGYATASISCNGFISPHTGLARGFELSVDVEQLRGGPKGLSRVVRGLNRRWRARTARDRGARRATRIARRWLEERQARQPFFLFMNYMDCHLPYRLRHPARHRFVARADRRRVDAVPQDPFGVMAGRATMSAQGLEDLKALYDGGLSYLDEHVGRIDACLRQSGASDRTLFIVTADHGESFGEHGLMDHQYGLYENLLSVPLVVRWPGRERAGAVDDRLVQLVDLFATVVDLTHGDAAASAATAGTSMVGSAPRQESLAEYLVPNTEAIRRRFPDADASRFDVAMRSIRRGPHKLIWRSDSRMELYDLETDPAELRDLAGARPDLVGELRSELGSRLGAWPNRAERPAVESGMELVRERLQALGYL